MGQLWVAAITDLVPKDQIGKAMSGLWSWMGLAIIGAPMLASRLTTRGTYQVAILVALGQLVADQFYLKETLKKDEMKPFPGFANPFEVFRMWTSGSLLATTSTLTSLQFMMDPKVLADFWIIFATGRIEMVTGELAVVYGVCRPRSSFRAKIHWLGNGQVWRAWIYNIDTCHQFC